MKKQKDEDVLEIHDLGRNEIKSGTFEIQNFVSGRYKDEE